MYLNEKSYQVRNSKLIIRRGYHVRFTRAARIAVTKNEKATAPGEPFSMGVPFVANGHRLRDCVYLNEKSYQELGTG